VRAWLKKWEGKVRVADYSTGGYEHLWDIEGPEEAIAELPKEWLCDSKWSNPELLERKATSRPMSLKNFKAMPSMLKVITAVCVVTALTPVLAILWPSLITVAGEPMSRTQFWNQGYGPYIILVCIPFAISAWLFVVRNAVGRATLLIGMCLTPVWEFVFIELPPRWLEELAGCMIPIGLVGIYLYGRKPVLEYFHVALLSKSD